MTWKKTANAVGKKVADIATSKATQAAAGAVVERFGPHRALSKIGLVLIVIGSIAIGLSWFWLTSWSFWCATVCGVGLVAVGFALRGVNNLLVNLLVRFINWVGRRVYSFVVRYMPRVYEFFKRLGRRGSAAPVEPSAPTEKEPDAPESDN